MFLFLILRPIEKLWPRHRTPLRRLGLRTDITHLLLTPLTQVAGIIAFIGVFVILFTAKLPPGLFNLIVNPLRWLLRASTYHAWMVTRYPPWEWEE